MVAALCARTARLDAADFYAAPDAVTNGAVQDGSLEHPWSLSTALSAPSEVKPGDTIWLRGGTYRGTFESFLSGTAAQPIVVRPFPGERAILDGGTANKPVLLTVWGSYTWFWGFEITSSSTSRFSSDTGSYPSDLNRPYECIANAQQAGSGVGVKIINMVIHDCGQGIALWQDAINAEAYGNLIYYNGWDAPDRGHGHGIYTQNRTGTRAIRDNIVFSNYGYDFHAYGSANAFLNGIWAEGNVLFNGGVLSWDGGNASFLLGGGRIAQSPRIISNFLYSAGAFDLGYSAGISNPTINDNYISNSANFVNVIGISMSGNTFLGPVSGFTPSNYPGNTYLSSRPTENRIFVRPNLYEPGRGHVVVYNWRLLPVVSVDLSGILKPGSTFEVRNAQDYFGPPVLTGVYAGGTVSLAMGGLSVEKPAGTAPPAPTGPEFNVFVVLTKSDGGLHKKVAYPQPEPVRPLGRTPGAR